MRWWHPLVSGDPTSVDAAGISMKHKIISEEGLSEQELAQRVFKLPKAKRKARG